MGARVNAWRQIERGLRLQRHAVLLPQPERLQGPNLILYNGAGFHPVLSLKSDTRRVSALVAELELIAKGVV
jgi:hypothetical protein